MQAANSLFRQELSSFECQLLSCQRRCAVPQDPSLSRQPALLLQGDTEALQGLSVTPMCDRGKVVVSTNQLRFINFFLKVRSGVMLQSSPLSVCLSADDMPQASLAEAALQKSCTASSGP